MGGPPVGSKKSRADQFLEKVEISALLHSARDVMRDFRLYYMIALQYLLGLREGELLMLEWTHLGPLDENGDPKTVRVPTLKKRLDIPPLMPVPVLSHPNIVRLAFDRNRQTLAERRNKAPFLFTGRDAKSGLSVTQHNRLFTEARIIAGIRPEITSHALRHSASTHIAEALFPIDTHAMREQFLRHESNNVTERYNHVPASGWARLRGALDLPPIAPLATSRSQR